MSESGSHQLLSEQRLPSASNPSDLAPGAPEELISPPTMAGPPPVDEEGVATIWRDVEPPEELGDRVPHTVTQSLPAPADWQMIGASRRGKMHAHKGIFREDAFALGQAEGWHLMVVSDGGGSCPLSRIGSQLAADTAVATMARIIKATSGAALSARETCETALRKGVEEAWETLQAEANERQVPLGHLGTTFLGVMHRPTEQGSILGVAQVGDGLVAAELADGKVVALAEPDVGETAGVTLFLTSKHWKEWMGRINVESLETSPQLLAAMCDGVADDFIPFNPHLRQLFNALGQVIEQEQPAEALLQLLGYEKRGSFDDRTLTLIYPARPKQEPELEDKSASELQMTESVPATLLLEAEPKDGPKIEAPVEEKPESPDLASDPPPDTGALPA